MTYFRQWQIRPGPTYIEGRAVYQGLRFKGSAIQGVRVVDFPDDAIADVFGWQALMIRGQDSRDQSG
jgi:hypothetical protein